jgi:hypothetical protein
MPKPKAKSTETKPLDIKNPDDNFPINQEKVTKPEKSGALCSVGLKLPNGLTLHLQHKITQPEARRDGTMGSAEMWVPDYSIEGVTLFGNAVPKGEQPRCLIVGGYAVTPNVSFDFMSAWMKQNQNLELVKNGLIIVHEKKSHVVGQAKEQAGHRSGLEAITPDSDPRIPRKKKKGGKEEAAITSGSADDEDGE